MTVTQNSSGMVELDPLNFPLWGSRLIEASAGTGKTYTIASLYVRLVLGHGDVAGGKVFTPPDILVVTFTRAATKELRDRIRQRLNEAASCFLQESEGDGFLQSLREEYTPQQWAGCARQLQIAAEWMDDAAVSTIDSWCYRVLREHAFDSGSLFNVEMDVDPFETVSEATRDYWRLFIASLPADAFAQIVSVIKNCERLSQTLHQDWLPHADAYPAVNAPLDLVARKLAIVQACKQHPWVEWADELSQIFTKAAGEKKFDQRKMNARVRENWLDQLRSWAQDPNAEYPFSTATPWQRLTPQGLAEVWNDASIPDHPCLKAIESLRGQLDNAAAELQRVYCHAARWVAARVLELRSKRALLDFNGLLQRLDEALQGPNGARLALVLRRQFPAALIDEFQDTNPVQYRIFDRVYGVQENSPDILLALIGDPKQAIYGFRGADIHAYLAARRACEGRIYTLGSNYRSTPEMVAAVNHLFDIGEQQREKAAFLFRRPAQNGQAESNPVPFMPVTAARNPGVFRLNGAAHAALTLWCETRAEASDDDVAAACASEVLRLLQSASSGEAGIENQDGFRPLEARDIAILVNGKKEAGLLGDALRRRGIRSVYLSDKASVFMSEAAGDVLTWLRACAEPEKGAHVRTALASGSLALEWAELDALVWDETRWEAMLERFAVYKEQWREQGVLPMLRRFMQDFNVPARLFEDQEKGGAEGERHLTDLLHLAELLQSASAKLDGEHALIRYLEQKISEGGDADADGDVARLRLESDAGLVQIVTVHKSKGLEYPLVFFPYGYRARVDYDTVFPVTYHDEHGRMQVLANPADADGKLLERIQAQRHHERLAEDLRKLYVALTRSRYACWMALLPTGTLPASAMGYLLGGDAACQSDTLLSAVEAVAAGCPDIAVMPLPEAQSGWWQGDMNSTVDTYVCRTMHRRIVSSWYLSSYSSLSRLAMKQAGTASLPVPETSLALPDEARLDTFLEGYHADASPPELQIEEQHTRPLQPVGLHAFPKGAAAGTVLHDLLEWVFRQGARATLSSPDVLKEHVSRRLASRGWSEHTEAVCRWLQDFFSCRFQSRKGTGSVDVVLAELQTAIPEMEFWFGMEDAHLPTLDGLISRHILSGRPRPLITQGRMRGLLRGFIDLVFERDGKYFVADYKSNLLGADASAYDTRALEEAILGHRYDLQSALYLFALHRLLRSRLGEAYDYDTHVGGGLVFFIRGIGSPTQGLHFERPPRELMEQMDALFSRPSEAHDDSMQQKGCAACS